MDPRILITLGPSSMNEASVKACADEGVYVFRFNLSHTPLDGLEQLVDRVRGWSDVPICFDSEGAQLRNGYMVNEAVNFVEGARVIVHTSPIIGDEGNISFNPPLAALKLIPGDVVHVDFNHVSFEIIEVNADHLVARVLDGGKVGSNKGAEVQRVLSFDPVTEKDRAAIALGRKIGIKNFALSFANSGADVRTMRDLCGKDASLICKIESPGGLSNLDDILTETDDILIDRGDLSRRVPIERVPFVQRYIVSVAKARGVPVYVATNLLESMVTTKAPNRAEVNDVISTLEMGADGLVLAAETAIGRYPVEATRMARALINQFQRWTPTSTIEDIVGN